MSQSLTHLFPALKPHWTERLSLAYRRVANARRRAATRGELAGMDERMLKDMGLSRAQAGFIAERPILAGLAGNLR